MYGYNDPMAKMPDADWVVVNYFKEVGVAMSGGMARSAITWQELDSYCSRSGNDLNWWECNQIIMMSRTYVSATCEFTDQNCEPPYQREYSEEELQVRSNAELAMFDSAFNF